MYLKILIFYGSKAFCSGHKKGTFNYLYPDIGFWGAFGGIYEVEIMVIYRLFFHWKKWAFFRNKRINALERFGHDFRTPSLC